MAFLACSGAGLPAELWGGEGGVCWQCPGGHSAVGRCTSLSLSCPCQAWSESCTKLLFVRPWCLIAAAEVWMPLSHTGPVCHILSVYSQVLSRGTELMAGVVCSGCGPGCCSSALVMGAPGFQTGSLCFAKSLFQYNSSCALVGACVECPCVVRKLHVKVALTLGGGSEDSWISFG